MKVGTTTTTALMAIIASVAVTTTTSAYIVQPPKGIRPVRTVVAKNSATTGTVMQMTSEENIPPPNSFREAEILGLRLMQEGKFEDALVAFDRGMKLPGTKKDVVRTKALSGPSPVGGAFGGTESQSVTSLDEFELQAAHYNMACAHARVGNLDESIMNLQKAFENGFDNFNTVRGDPDLDPIKKEKDFLKLMEGYEPGNFNPFGFLGKQQ